MFSLSHSRHRQTPSERQTAHPTLADIPTPLAGGGNDKHERKTAKPFSEICTIKYRKYWRISNGG